MKNKIHKFTLNSIFVLSVLACVLLPTANAGRSIPDDNLSYPVLITLSNGVKASGFYLNTESSTYFVTARHVLFHENSFTLKSKGAELLSYPKDIQEQGRIILTIDLDILSKNGQVIYHREQDVAAILIGNDVETNGKKILKLVEGVILKQSSPSGLLGVGISNIKKYDQVLIGNDIFIFGYPISIGLKDIPQIDYGKPLLRKGIVAGKNEKARSIILDCPSYKGNSGSPVIEMEQVGLANYKFRLIGMIVNFIPYAEEWINKTHGYSNITISNSDYSVVVPVDFILELLVDSRKSANIGNNSKSLAQERN